MEKSKYTMMGEQGEEISTIMHVSDLYRIFEEEIMEEIEL